MPPALVAFSVTCPGSTDCSSTPARSTVNAGPVAQPLSSASTCSAPLVAPAGTCTVTAPSPPVAATATPSNFTCTSADEYSPPAARSIVTASPGPASAGEYDATANSGIVSSTESPYGSAIVTVPPMKPAGTVALPSFATATGDDAPANVADAPPRWEPVSRSVPPGASACGDTDATAKSPNCAGAWIVERPFVTVTVVSPAIAGTTTLSDVPVCAEIDAASGPNVTLVTPVSPTPFSDTVAPGAPYGCEKPVIENVTWNGRPVAPAANPWTPIGPDVAPGGTATLSQVAAVAVGVAATPPKSTLATLFRPVPVTVTTAPTGPLAGEKPRTVGSTWNVSTADVVPPAFVTATAPSTAAFGTVATSDAP